MEKDFPCQENRGMSATKKKREVKICIFKVAPLRIRVQGNGQRCKFVLCSFTAYHGNSNSLKPFFPCNHAA